MRKFYVFLAAALCFTFTACEKNNDPSLGKKAKYTVLLYANGGENLDYAIEKDISQAAEFINSKQNDNSVRMVTYMKYSSQEGLDALKYIPGGKAGEVYYYEVDDDCYKNRDPKQEQFLALPDQWINAHSNAAMYEPGFLSDVLKDVAKKCPAENYILIIAGHASGWCVNDDGEYPEPNQKPAAAMTDGNFNGRAITAKELASAIRQANINLSTVVFDCCFQNSIEYLSELTDVPGLKYTLGSGHSTKGGDYSDLVAELFKAANGSQDLVKALSNYAETYAERHKQSYLDYNDVVLMNVDFAVVDLAKLKETWTPIKNMVDFLCSNYNAADSAKYVTPTRYCYQYYNWAPKYDLIDYLTQLQTKDAPYANNAQYATLLNAVTQAFKSCILHHAYSLNYVDDAAKPKDQADKFVTMSINLGAKGRLQIDWDIENDTHLCYDYEGKPWYISADGNTWTPATGESVSLYYNWTYSYDKSTFEAKTGWTRWLKLNPVMPCNNPPFGDEGDTSGNY